MPWRHFSISHQQSASLRLLDRVGSTMDAVRRELQRGRVAFDHFGQPRYIGVMAREQTAGRGQRGRLWFTPYNEALSVTYFLRHRFAEPQRASRLALLVGAGVADSVRALLTESAAARNQQESAAISRESCASDPDLPDIGLKWPNDILLNGRKLGGILIEMVKAPDGNWVALVGIGLNLAVRAFPPELASTAASLLLEAPFVPQIAPESMAVRIARAFPPLISLSRAQGFPALLERWRIYDRTPGRRYATDIQGISTEGIAIGIDADGALLLRFPDGRVQAVSSASALRESQHPALVSPARSPDTAEG